MGGKGYIAEGIVTEDPRPPKSRNEAPWPGGLYSFGWVIPFDIVVEVKSAVEFPFTGHYQDRTGVTKSALQRSLTLVGAEGVTIIGAGLREQASVERAEAEECK